MYASGNGVPAVIVSKLPAMRLRSLAAGLDWEAMEIEENKPLAPLTTLGIGGPARWFADARSEEDVAEAAEWAGVRSIPLFVLGGGSNLLVADAGFDGLVLRVGLKGIVSGASGELVQGIPSGAEAREDFGGSMNGLERVPFHSEPAPFTPEPVPFAPKPGPVAREIDSAEMIYAVAAGESWDEVVRRAVEDDCAGIECLAGIPGTVGGTPVQNVGAYGQEVASTIERVRVFDLQERAFVELSNEECGFAYRRSVMNSSRRGRYVVTRVDYLLRRSGDATIRYAELTRALEMARGKDASEPSLAEVAATVRELRRGKGMLLQAGDADCRSAGSFFKNPVVSEEKYSRIRAASGEEPPRFAVEQGTELVTFPALVKVPAAWLVERAGFQKGYAPGAAGVSTRHTLALVNRGGATAADVMRLAEEIVDAVASKFDVRLEMEPVRLGF
jgi:UDP-N-acetylmuramate dehydrogenase